jgi:hypothetical protein
MRFIHPRRHQLGAGCCKETFSCHGVIDPSTLREVSARMLSPMPQTGHRSMLPRAPFEHPSRNPRFHT